MPYATVADLAVKWRKPIEGADALAAQVLLDEAEALLRSEVSGLDAALLAGTVDPILVRKVMTDAILRVLRNPAGVTTQVVGPESATFSGLAQRAELAFLASELEMVTPSEDGASVGGYAIGSFRLARPNWCDPRPWC